MSKFSHYIRTPITLLLSMTLLLGLLYPFTITAVNQTLFPTASEGSLIMQGEVVVGSTLLGQEFNTPNYFWGRPSASTPPYNAARSGASNLSPASKIFISNVETRMKRLQQLSPNKKDIIPLDLVTASASGLDPHISVAAAYYQVSRIVKYRKQKVEAINALVAQHIEARSLGFLGEPRVNVVQLNLALDALSKKKK